MKPFRPRSFVNLVLIGFVMVSLPLGVGLWTTLTFIDRVSGTGLAIVEHALNGTRTSAMLSEYLRNEERFLRLYEITEEGEHLASAEDYHGQIDTLLYDLLSLPLDVADREELEAMRRERNVQRALIISLRDKTKGEPLAEDIARAIESFAVQQQQAQKARVGFQAMMEREIATLQTTTKEAQKALVLQTGAFILATIVLIGVMAFLLSWPIRQLNKSVERLGKGDFKTPVIVNGPLDLEAAGARLDWLRKRLAELEQEKAKFLAHISHELKTPLASLREGASLLNEGVVGALNEKQRTVARILANNSIVLQGMIENMIDFNLARFNEKAQQPDRIDLRRLIEKIVGDHSAEIMSRRLRVDITVADAMVHGDGREIETIFVNLLSNAIKFSPPGSTVGCRLQTRGAAAACVIYDSGPGIPVGEEEKIFQPFYQVETSSHSFIKGSGLGLAIVAEYVKRQGGRIRVLNPGQPGARFGLILPLSKQGIVPEEGTA